jgi:exo-beta-1,3-glucanase (GH17 family)
MVSLLRQARTAVSSIGALAIILILLVAGASTPALSITVSLSEMSRLGSSTPTPLSTPAVGGGADVGFQFHGMWSDYSDSQRATVLDEMKAAGMQWVRLDVSYASPFSQVDPVINAVTARGMKLLVTLWNADQQGSVPGPEFATAAKAFATRYAGKVQAWEAWNEPDQVGWSPAQYTAVLRSVYPAFKAGDPRAQVVFSGTVGNNDQWIADAYAAGAKSYFDVMATHPYQATADLYPEAPDTDGRFRLTHVAAVHNLMVAKGDGDKPIWFTEFGWSSHTNDGIDLNSGADNWLHGVTPQQQADYFVRTVKLVRSSFPYVTGLFWYTDRDRHDSGIQNDNYGLLSYELTPKPVYSAIKSYLATP